MSANLRPIEFKRLTRSRELRWLLLVAGLLSIAGGLASLSTTLNNAQSHERAVAMASEEWRSLGDYNPHSAAHFGRFAFKELGPLSLIERGVEPYVGGIIHMEAHVQKEAVFSEVSQQSLIARADSIEPGFILHVLFPILLIIMASRSVEEVRSSGRVPLLLTRGASGGDIISAPTSVLWLLSCLLALALILIQALLALREGMAFQWGDLAVYLGATVLYYKVVIALGAGLAAIPKRSGASTPLVVALLLLWSLVLPRLTMQGASLAHPLPSRTAEDDQKSKERQEGMDGHNPADERRAALERRILDEYGVETKEDLPINMDGLVMQADEEVGNAVWDAHFNKHLAIIESQEAMIQRLGFANPFQALKRIARASAGTDTASAMAFQLQAEAYRRDLVQALNHETAYGGAKSGDWSWKAKASFYEDIPPFTYTLRPLGERLKGLLPEFIALALWLAISLGITRVGARRLEAQWRQ